MTDSPYLRCVACGWVHCAATEADEAFEVLDRCFKCKGLAFEVIAPDAAPRGVTLLPVRWPPIKRCPTVPKDQLAAAMIERPACPTQAPSEYEEQLAVGRALVERHKKAFWLSLLQNSSNAANFPCVRGAERPALRPARA
ncbi:MAG TPA: hypothetical protein VJY15_10020 [Candidatus Acidoferrum sp.]|nr:hypothetical protein [Candidatus Acidoferrum sp.]